MKRLTKNRILRALRSVGYLQVLFFAVVIILGLGMALGFIEVGFRNPYNNG